MSVKTKAGSVRHDGSVTVGGGAASLCGFAGQKSWPLSDQHVDVRRSPVYRFQLTLS